MFANLSRVLHTDQLKTVYYAYVQSVLQYGIIAWGGVFSTILNPLQITQKSIIKAALQKSRRFSTNELFDKFKVFDIRQLYIKCLSVYAFKNNYNFLHRNEHGHATRYQQQVGLVTPRVTKTINTTNSAYIAHILFQSIPAELRDAGGGSLARCKKCLSLWLISLGREGTNRLITSIYSS